MQVSVEFENGKLRSYRLSSMSTRGAKSTLQKHRVTTALLCELKRKINFDAKIRPQNQKLRFESSVTDFNDLFFSQSTPHLQCIERKRAAANTVKICDWNSNTFELPVSDKDTLLDIKFLLAERCNTKPEYIHFVLDYKKRLLDNNQNIVESGLLNVRNEDRIVHFWLEVPSNNGEFVVRSNHNLVDFNPKTPTIAHFLRYYCDQFSMLPHLGVRKENSDGTHGDYSFFTYAEVNKRVSNIAAGLRTLGLKADTRLGICSANRSEWVLCDYAGHTQSMVTVPLYDTLAKNAIEYIVNHASVQICMVDTNTLTEVVKAKTLCPTLKYIILMDDNASERQFAQNNPNAGFTHRLSQIEQLGARNPVSDVFPKPSDLATICYTSGTTGDPKGAMLTHRNIMSSVESFRIRLNESFDRMDGQPSVLSYLPLAHMYEKLVELLMLQFGGKIGYWRGDKLLLLEDIQALEPTYFPSVPRIFQKFQDKILAGVNQANFIRRTLFNQAFKSKSTALREGRTPPHIWDKLVFSKVKATFGGKIQCSYSGSAPLSVSTADFIRTVFTDELGEGYGLTETVAAGTNTDVADTGTFSHVGATSPCIEMKLMDVEDMNYLTSDEPCPRGEIWFRGPPIFQGYYKSPDITKGVLTRDGWFATGDIGQWRLDGKLQIIDRKKNIFKLAQGEYIRPEYIENVYKMSAFVGNIFVHGNSDQTYLVAIVWPDPEMLAMWAESNGLKHIANNFNELIKNPKVKQMVRSDMDKIASREDLKGFEKVKRIHFIQEDFTIESGLLTSTMKLKRGHARKVFKQVIENMYEQAARSKL